MFAAIRFAGGFLLLSCNTIGLELRKVFDCPLCVAEENCHVACTRVRHQSPGSAYCMNSCIGAHPDDSFDETWFANADRAETERKQLDANIKELGRELAADVAATK
mmetsp:Transcript_126154/g.362853  ORF Transcript_126154/g.362853 Transcript_126154/m.362853 type:complete len:106 (-) Transcript_126154:147-464(-)